MFQLIAAIFPGTSRSGATIVGALLLGVSRTVAAEYTFFPCNPGYVWSQSFETRAKFVHERILMTSQEGVILAGWEWLLHLQCRSVVIKFLMGYIKKHDFKVFGWYRIILGAIVLLCGVCGLLP